MTEPNFRREWLDGNWVPVKLDAGEGEIYYELRPDSILRKAGIIGEDSETRVDRERMEIKRRLDEEKARAYAIEKTYYGGSPYGRLDSFGIVLKSSDETDILKAADDLILKSSLARFDKKEKEIKAMARTKKAEKTNPFRKGRATGVKGKGGQFLRLGEGESVVFAPMVGLEDMISADMHEYWDLKPAIYHPCIGDDNCPGCLVDNEARFKAYLPVLVKATGEPAIYPFTISVYNQLEALEDEIMEDDPKATLKGFVVKVSRKGAGMATRYTVMGVGSRIDLSDAEIPDFVQALGPQTEDNIWELLEKNGYDRNDFVTVAKPSATATDEESAAGDWGDV